MKFYPILCGVLLTLSIACGHSNEPVEDKTLGFVDAGVESNSTNFKHKANYSNQTPGTSVRYERSFENAPPLIPHTTEGFPPITAKTNICLSCHLPAVAKSVKATPISPTHFNLMRQQMVVQNGKYVHVGDNKAFVQKLDKLNNAYFTCTLCHVPQASVSVDIVNLFTPEFRNKLQKQNSNLNDHLTEGLNK